MMILYHIQVIETDLQFPIIISQCIDYFLPGVGGLGLGLGCGKLGPLSCDFICTKPIRRLTFGNGFNLPCLVVLQSLRFTQ